MTVAADDYSCGSRLWQQSLSYQCSRWMTIAVIVVAVDVYRSADHRDGGCRGDAHVVMLGAIDG